VILQVWETYIPLWKLGTQIPHDGIVEESSNCLIPASGILGYVSEKTSQIDFPGQYTAHTYVHVIHNACLDLTHVTLQHDPEVIEMVAEIILASSLDSWIKDVFATEKFRSLTSPPRFHKPAQGNHASCGLG
jgi:hypothetical protein